MKNILPLLVLTIASGLSAQITVTGTIKSGGLTRDYRLYKPAAYTGATAVPLVINMHGYGSNNQEQEAYAYFRAVADTANFLIALPNGTIDPQGQRFWNTFGGTSTVDDVGFISNLIDSLKQSYNIDPQRIYATGMSNGGFMSYALACELNSKIAAIASVTGSMVTASLNSCNPSRPVPVMEIHGDADDVVPYNGGTLLNFEPIPDVVAAWVDINNCNPTPVTTNVPNINTNDGCTAQLSVYSNGDNGSSVEHYHILGGGHTWPGSLFTIGVTNQDFNACYVIWKFFLKYRLDDLSPTGAPDAGRQNVHVYPNPVQDYLLLQAAENEPVDHIEVYDVTGNLVQTINPGSTNTVRVETSEWPVGMYFLKISQGASTNTVKIVRAD